MLQEMVRDATNLGNSVGNPFGVAAFHARMLAGFIVPALKQVAPRNAQPYIVTHETGMTTAGSVAGETANATLRFTSDSDFLMTGMSTISGTTGVTAYNYDLNLIFGASERNFVNRGAGVHAEALMGAEHEAFGMPQAMVIRKSSTIRVEVTSTTSTALANVFFYAIGIKHYDINALDATINSLGR